MLLLLAVLIVGSAFGATPPDSVIAFAFYPEDSVYSAPLNQVVLKITNGVAPVPPNIAFVSLRAINATSSSTVAIAPNSGINYNQVAPQTLATFSIPDEWVGQRVQFSLALSWNGEGRIFSFYVSRAFVFVGGGGRDAPAGASLQSPLILLAGGDYGAVDYPEIFRDGWREGDSSDDRSIATEPSRESSSPLPMRTLHKESTAEQQPSTETEASRSASGEPKLTTREIHHYSSLPNAVSRRPAGRRKAKGLRGGRNLSASAAARSTAPIALAMLSLLACFQ